MNKLQRDLFSLLRLGLWEDAAKLKPKGIDWGQMFTLTNEQAVMGIVMDGMERLKEKTIPSRDMKMKWIGISMKIARQNQRINGTLGRLWTQFHKMGFSPVLMKGQAFAANYPVPLHRQSGDIDIYFKHRGECEKAVAWAKIIDMEAASSSENVRERKHFTFMIDGVTVELHYYMCLFDSPRLHRRLQEIIDEEFDKEESFSVAIEGRAYETVPPTLSLLHQIIHISRHLLEAGIGLRQVCDMALYIDKYHTQIDAIRLQEYLEELQLSTIAAALGDLLVCCFGLDRRKIPFPVCGVHTSFILHEIFEGGNFGKKKVTYRSHGDSVSRKLRSVFFFYRRCKLYNKLFPDEAKHYFMNKISLNLRLIGR